MFKSAYDKLGGIVWIPRMLEKIRMNQQKELPKEYLPYLGKGFDGRCTEFLGIDYDALVDRTIQGGTDDEILEWIFEKGRKPSKVEILEWNEFLSKQGAGTSDQEAADFQAYKARYGLGHRSDILSYFDFYEVDEGRKP